MNLATVKVKARNRDRVEVWFTKVVSSAADLQIGKKLTIPLENNISNVNDAWFFMVNNLLKNLNNGNTISI